MRQQLKVALRRDEGCRLRMYDDSRGLATIGYGHNLRQPITQRVAELMLTDDIDQTVAQLDARLAWWRALDEPRAAALANMAYNLGISGLVGFEHMLAALQAQQWKRAHDEALDSRWARQVGRRAQRIARQFLTGEFQYVDAV